MPSPNPTTRREYKGAAAATTLQNSMTNVDTAFVLVAANNWPTGAVGNFVVTINRGQSDEEKILCSAQSTRTVTAVTRGFDGTTAQSHAAGATAECTLSAFDADEWNQHTNATSGVHGVAGAVVGTTDTQTLTNKTITGGTLDAASTIGGVSGTTLAADHAAWTGYTPTLTGFPATINAARYLQVGKTVTVQVSLTLTGAGSGTFLVSCPVTPKSQGIDTVVGAAWAGASANSVGAAYIPSGTSNFGFVSTGAWNTTVPVTWANGNVLRFTAVYEAA